MKPLLHIAAAIASLAAGDLRVGYCAQSDSSADWALIERDVAAMSEKTSSGDSYVDFVKNAEARDRLHKRLRAFVSQHPSDKRVPEAKFQLLMRPPVFLLEANPDRFRESGSTQQKLLDWERSDCMKRQVFLKTQ